MKFEMNFKGIFKETLQSHVMVSRSHRWGTHIGKC